MKRPEPQEHRYRACDPNNPLDTNRGSAQARYGRTVECAVYVDNLRTVSQALLAEPIAHPDTSRMTRLCHALERATGC